MIDFNFFSRKISKDKTYNWYERSDTTDTIFARNY